MSTGARPFIAAAVVAGAACRAAIKSHEIMARHSPVTGAKLNFTDTGSSAHSALSRSGSAPARFPIIQGGIRLKRPCEVEALARCAAKGGERRCELDGLDPLRRRGHAQRLGKAQDRANDGDA